MNIPVRERIDTDELLRLSQSADIDRARKSFALEQELEPELASARSTATSRFSELLAQGTQLPSNQQQLLEREFTQGQQLPETFRNEQQRILQAQKDPSRLFTTAEKNLLFGQAFQGASGMAGRSLQEVGGLAFGKEILNQRSLLSQQAMNAGQFEAGFNQQNLSNRINIADFLDRQRQQEFANYQSATGLMQSIQRPQVGITGADVSSARIGDINAQNAYNLEAAKLSAMSGGKKKKGMGSTIGSVVGGVAGSFFGPAGTMIGASLGGAIGGAIDGGSEGAVEGGMQGFGLGSSAGFQGAAGAMGSGLKTAAVGQGVSGAGVAQIGQDMTAAGFSPSEVRMEQFRAGGASGFFSNLFNTDVGGGSSGGSSGGGSSGGGFNFGSSFK